MKNIDEVFKTANEMIFNEKELISYNITLEFRDALISKTNTLNKLLSSDKSVIDRFNYEVQYYSYLENSLLSNLKANKFYSEVNVFNTRRFVTSSNNCISVIHVLIRDKIHVNVYMRSSDFKNAFPGDLSFLGSLPEKIISHLENNINTVGYEEITKDECLRLRDKNVIININFGSLH